MEAPLDPQELVFDIEPGDELWKIVGPTLESPAHSVANPLVDRDFQALLAEFRASASRPVPLDLPGAREKEEEIQQLARRIGRRLTPVLLSAQAQEAVVQRIRQVSYGRARMTLRVQGAGRWGDLALALPWELLAPVPDSPPPVFEAALDIVREVVSEGSPELPLPTGPLRVAVTISAPEDQSALRYEDESYRLYSALAGLGQQVAFADLGGVEDLIQVVSEQRAAAVHFSGHGLPGSLVFEDETGCAEVVAIDELIRRMQVVLLKSGQAGSFPQLFFLASCHGATSVRQPGVGERGLFGRELDEGGATGLAIGPSTAAALHRSGFVQVVGYSGPIGDDLCTRAEEAFYRALSEGETTLQAVAEARGTLIEPLQVEGLRVRYPLGWAQLAVYHRGPDRPLAIPGKPAAPRGFRATQDVSGLPVLKFGFIGQRGLQHEVRKKIKDRQTLLVLQGLGGLGKTALASHLLTRAFATEEKDRLVLRCDGLQDVANPIAELRDQAEKHGEGLPAWEEAKRELRRRFPEEEPVAGFAAVVERLRQERPGLVVYADNVEALQVRPDSATGGADPLGSWRPEAEEWWAEMERLSQGGLILASTRYAWAGLDPRAWIGIEPMSRADTLRLLDSFKALAELSLAVRQRLADRVDRHPRTVELLAGLVEGQRRELGLGAEIADEWEELVVPVLPRNAEQIRADLLLAEVWRRLPGETRRHAGRLIVLRVPAPLQVVDRLGNASGRDGLVRSSLLSRFRERLLVRGEASWLNRWGFHALVRELVAAQPEAAVGREAHEVAGRAYAALIGSDPVGEETYIEIVREDRARWPLLAETVHHLLAADRGDEAWPFAHEHAVVLRDRGRYREALRILEACETAGIQGEPLAESFVLRAQFHRMLGHSIEESQRLLERALSFKIQPSLRAIALVEQGMLEELQGRLGAAEERTREGLRLIEGDEGPASGIYALLLHESARLAMLQEKWEEAEPLLRRSLSIAENVIVPVHPELGKILGSLAGVLVYLGKNEEAEPLLHRSIEILEKSSGEGDISLSVPLTSLARIMTYDERAAKGEKLAQRALDIVLRSDREDATRNPELGIVLAILARAQSAQGKPEAVVTARQALEILASSYPPDHQGVEAMRSALREIVDQGSTVEDRFQALEPQREIASEQGEVDSALVIQERIVAMIRTRQGRDGHMALASHLQELAALYRRAGRYEDAVRALEEAVELGEQYSHPNLDALKSALSVARISLGLLEFLDQKGFKTDMADVALFRESDVQSRKAWDSKERGDVPAAVAGLERSIALLRKVKEHRLKPERMRAFLLHLGRFYRQAGQLRESIAALEEAAALAQEDRDEDLETYRHDLEQTRNALARAAMEKGTAST
ncbi:MAG: hypothetical protein QOF89_1977 [Acidobacteriota bacterium]|jgi:tetratricopeptide (TPR) repeat protein|nr:hypothetical protein [Acidobacteriota bacterium]